MTDDMREVQLKQVTTLQQQMNLPDEQGRHATICLAHMVKPGNSVVSREALDALLAALGEENPAQMRKQAAWALGGLAGWVPTYDLAERVVPALIHALQLDHVGMPDVLVAGQAYHSLLYVGTPDAIAATEAYRAKVIAEKNLPQQ
jgi:PBS lyase HEAT-like repeat